MGILVLVFHSSLRACLSSIMSLPSESTDDLSVDVSESSKREYLLAQIRQKDAIIESLLKQVCRS